MRERAVAELSAPESPAIAELRRGWCLGGAGFRERMLGLLEAGLPALGLSADDFARLKKGDGRKIALAAAIRTRTTVPNAWIAKVLHLGHVSRVSRCVLKASPHLTRHLASSLEK